MKWKSKKQELEECLLDNESNGPEYRQELMEGGDDDEIQIDDLPPPANPRTPP